MIVLHLLFYLLLFVLIWYGAGLIVKAIDKFSKRIKISSFAVSFFILGILTSLPEMAVGINSILEKDPEIFIGNLIGGIIVIFLFIIPLLAIVGNGTRLNHELNAQKLFLSLVVIGAPALLISDRRITSYEGILLILLYIILFYFIEKKQNLMEKIENQFEHTNINLFKDLFNIIFGVAIVFLSSRFLVEETIYFSNILKISPFFISLIVLSLGTNLPELLVGVRSLASGKKDIAFGDYIGSAAANTLIFGVLTVVNGKDIIIPDHFLQRFIFITLGLGFFYLFSRSKNDISKKEGIILLTFYILFFAVEFIIK